MEEPEKPVITDQEGIFDMIFDKDELSWQSIIYELVRSNQMDPWDIDISLLSQKFLEMLRKLKELDFRISGKVVLAATLLLKIKSNRLVGADLDYLDSLFAQKDVPDEYSDEFADELSQAAAQLTEHRYQLLPRTPQARRRKVSIYDLMEALQKAMEVKKRRVLRELPPLGLEPPKKSKDISEVIREVYGRIKSFFVKNKSKLTFSQLVPSDSKEDKVYTFVPLLHLDNARKIDISQQQHFGEIEIELLKKKTREEVNTELGAEA